MSSTGDTLGDVGFGVSRGPRPEATALRWLELLPTTRRALEELINWLDVASHSSEADGAAGSRSNEEQLATSALVSGDRGFGKTTVLLSAAYALRSPKEFTTPRTGGSSCLLEDPREKTRCEQLVKTLERLSESIVWLDVLDMEPLPTQVNLLATLLVRVRNALDPGPERKRKDRWAPPSLLEEGLNDPYGKIDKLVRDATFMWEDSAVQGKDSRQRAEQQIKAAEIYATFRRDFFDAMDAVSRLLAERRFGHGTPRKVLLVLPIDNVDRSIQHLHLILKLTRMVASRQLWFVLASGRSEFQLFLERSFQVELTSSGQTSLGLKSWEETLAIARRQAAAAMRRVLPPIHRIQIDSLTPMQAWRFEAPAPLSSSKHDARSLSHFLRKIRLPWQQEESHGLRCFADLFDIRERLIVWDDEDPSKMKDSSLLEEYSQLLREQGDYTPEEVGRLRAFIQFLAQEKKVTREGEDDWERVRENAPPILSHAARLALTVSARTALDLWQAVRIAAQETERHIQQEHALLEGTSRQKQGGDLECEFCEEQSIKIAETMLRASIDESELPGWASEQLLNRIMRRNAQGRIVLDLTGNPVQRLRRTILSEVLGWGPEKLESGQFQLLRTELHLRHFQDVIFELHELDEPGRKALMPASVAGWFMLLHDLLVLTRERRVMNLSLTPGEMLPELTMTQHEVLLRPPSIDKLDAELEFWWLLPNWNTFIDFVIFTTQWKAFLHYRLQRLIQEKLIQEKLQPASTSADSDAGEFDAKRFSIVMAAWIDNVCSVAGARRGGWDWTKLKRVVYLREEALKFIAGEPFFDYVRSVVDNIEALSARAWKERSSPHRLGIACVWLEQCLPLLLGSEFIPPASRRHFVTAMEPRPSGPTRHEWRSRYEKGLDSDVLKQRRYALVRGAVERSRAYKSHKKLQDVVLGANALSLRGWVSRACDEWIALCRAAEMEKANGTKKPTKTKKAAEAKKAPGKRKVLQEGRLRREEAVHREVRAPAKGRRGSRR